MNSLKAKPYETFGLGIESDNSEYNDLTSWMESVIGKEAVDHILEMLAVDDYNTDYYPALFKALSYEGYNLIPIYCNFMHGFTFSVHPTRDASCVGYIDLLQVEDINQVLKDLYHEYNKLSLKEKMKAYKKK